MGTNYYIHLGKRTADGGGKCRFYVALDPEVPEQWGGLTVIDEYGAEQPYSEFLHTIANDTRDYSGTGQEFS